MSGYRYSTKLAAAVVAASLITAVAAPAFAGCAGKFIVNGNLSPLNFYDGDGTTVVASFKDKTQNNSLHIAIQACDETYFYVVLPDGKPAEVMRTAVGTNESICDLDTTPTSAPVDVQKAGAQAAFNGGVKCKGGVH